MPKSLVEAMKCLTEVRFGPNSLEQVCHLLVTLTCEVMPAPSAAAIALGPASPSDLTITPITACPLDSLSWDGGDGPIGDAATTVSQVHAHGDLSSWPAFAKRADPCGVTDAIVTPVAVNNNKRGYLSVYALAGRFADEHSVLLSAIVERAAAQIANALLFDELTLRNGQLHEGLRSREMIGLAKGILMHQESCSEKDAFRILVRGSQRLQRRVRDVAEQVVALAEGRAEMDRNP